MLEDSVRASGNVIKSSGDAFQRRMNSHLGTRFELKPIGSRHLQGEIQTSRITRLMRMADIRFSAHSTRLMHTGPANPDDAFFLVSWQREGRTLVSQSGRETEIGPGNIFVIDTTKPFNIETTDLWTNSVYLRNHLIRDSFPESSALTAVPFPTDTGPGRICALLFEELFETEHRLDDRALTRYAHSIPNLLAIALAEAVSPDAGGSAHKSLTVERIKRFVRENLSAPDLDCDLISAEIGLSVRQIHQIFRSQDTTLMRWVWSERLKKIAKDLANPNLASFGISSIAFDWGFSDAAHFSRAFKSAFGETPRDFRRKALSDSD